MQDDINIPLISFILIFSNLNKNSITNQKIYFKIFCMLYMQLQKHHVISILLIIIPKVKI